jgi:hypothetical protein
MRPRRRQKAADTGDVPGKIPRRGGGPNGDRDFDTMFVFELRTRIRMHFVRRVIKMSIAKGGDRAARFRFSLPAPFPLLENATNLRSGVRMVQNVRTLR